MEIQLTPAARTQQTFQLPDGRTLGFDEYGDPQGRPLFYFYHSEADPALTCPHDQLKTPPAMGEFFVSRN